MKTCAAVGWRPGGALARAPRIEIVPIPTGRFLDSWAWEEWDSRGDFGEERGCP